VGASGPTEIESGESGNARRRNPPGSLEPAYSHRAAMRTTPVSVPSANAAMPSRPNRRRPERSAGILACPRVGLGRA